MTLIPGGPDLAGMLKAQRSRLIQAQEWIRLSWPDGTPQEHATLFGKVQEWIEKGGTPPWEVPPAGPPHAYPPYPATRSDRPL